MKDKVSAEFFQHFWSLVRCKWSSVIMKEKRCFTISELWPETLQTLEHNGQFMTIDVCCDRLSKF
ncbi:hypothetical protein M514_06747 [Trichuris suis]|uniref:Uncharacterized protein n=1 Tax=Trichuris suis TaxID=68888 RepID=A0A085NKF3_9BILA|nr:hypothetical protein M513_06747 [Trichuris suis]KFD69949.1 hypothetical protein M514_06747 [Trichuris suis]